MGTVNAKENTFVSPVANTSKTEIHGADDFDLESVSARVRKINIQGLRRTKNDIVMKQVKELFQVDNFQEMILKSQEVKLKMESMGLFKQVSLYIDTSKGDNAPFNGYDLTFKVKEHRRFAGGVNTLVGTNDGSIMFDLRLPNTLGRAEKVSGDYSYGTNGAVGFGLHFSKPLQGDPNLLFSGGLSQTTAEYPWSGFTEIGRGITAGLKFPTLVGDHSLSWEGVWREVGALKNTVPFEIRQEAGHSLKSSIKHEWKRDTRDSPVLPSTGWCVKSVQELAGLGGDVNYMKQDLEMQFNKELALDSVFQVSLAGGLMRPIQAGSQLKLPDRFFLGGPLTLRGFNIKGCGPHEGGCALGADTYWLTAAHIYTPLPFMSGKEGFCRFFRTHLFVNAGNLTNINLHNQWKQNLAELATSLRWSYGAGLVMRLGGIARLELNYCVPMKTAEKDSVHPGLQFGIGVTFL